MGVEALKNRQIYLIELENTKRVDLNKNKDFTENIQTAILLSLFERGKLTKWQFDFCMDELKAIPHNLRLKP